MSDAVMESGKDKPIFLRVIFVLSALLIVAATGFYIAIGIMGISIGGAVASTILYTLIGRIVLFGAMIYFILNRNMAGLRACIGLNFLISIPGKAIIGFVVAAICMALTFTPSVKRYFAYRGS